MKSYIQRVNQAFPNMTQILKPCESEHFAILHFTVTARDVKHCELLDAIHGRSEYLGFKAGEYVKLCRKPVTDGMMMSNTFMEKETQLEVVENAHGDVLIAGLGIGMVLMAIQGLRKVNSVTVVEKEQEVIDLVKPQLPLNQRVTVIPVDIFNYVPNPQQKFDTIYFDIWDNICGDNWEEMKKLERKFRHLLKPKGWMSCWRREDTKYAARS